MVKKNVTPDALIKTAQKLLKERYMKEGHHFVVSAALVTESGNVYSALHLGTNQPSLATCAEIITIGHAATAEKDMKIKMIVAVRDQDGYVISPCGKCREYIADYGPDAEVIMPADNKKGYEVVPISDLIPNKYKKRTEPCK